MRKSIKNFIVTLIIGSLLVGTGVFYSSYSNEKRVGAIPQELKLKSSPNKILATYQYKDGIRYKYVSDKIRGADKYKGFDEDLSRRSSESQTFKTGRKIKGQDEYVMKFYGEQFFSGNNNEYEVDQATTTKEAFDLQNSVSFLDKIINIAQAAISTSSTNNANVEISALDGDTYMDPAVYEIQTFKYTNNGSDRRTLIRFTLPSLSGTISKVTLNLKSSGGPNTVGTVNAHQLSRTDWIQAQTTWVKYKTGVSWTTAGGDFNSTVIDAVSSPADVNQLLTVVLLGTGSDNPLTINWGDVLNILLKIADGTYSTFTGCTYYSKEDGGTTNSPYLEITYTAAAGSSPKAQILNFE